jgi:diguanylate cyclase (GGDEF)-like protein
VSDVEGALVVLATINPDMSYSRKGNFRMAVDVSPRTWRPIDQQSLNERLAHMSDHAIDRSMLAIVIFVIPAVAASVFRSQSTGWLPLYSLQLAVFAAAAIAALYRARLTRVAKCAIVVGTLLAGHLNSLVAFGYVAQTVWLTMVAVCLLGMACSIRTQLLTALSIGVMTLSTAVAHEQGFLVSGFTPLEFALAPASWVIATFLTCLYIALLMVSVVASRDAMEQLLNHARRQRDQISHLATHDALTGLPRLKLCRERIVVACHRAARLNASTAVMYVDLDGFKAVNDTHGHAAGDFCLKAAATRFRGALRAEDTVARIGGDEFVVVLARVSGRAGAAVAAQKLIDSLTDPIAHNGVALHVGASAGIAIFPVHGRDADTLTRAADQAMYLSKRFSRNGFFFADSVSGAGDSTAAHPIAENPIAHHAPEDDMPQSGSELQTRIVDRIYQLLLVVLPITCLIYVDRLADENWQDAALMGGLLAMPVLFFIALCRHRVSLRLKSSLLCIATLAIGLSDLYTFGLLSPEAPWTNALGLLLVAFLCPKRIFLVAAMMVPVATAAIGSGFLTGKLSVPLDAIAQGSMETWLIYTLSGAVFTLVTLFSWHSYKYCFAAATRETLQQADELAELALYDPLTSLPTSRLAQDQLSFACERAKRSGDKVAAMVIDLDGFKRINDSFGHDAGDYCLQVIGQRMRAVLHADDTVARIGGDEFLAVVGSLKDSGPAATIAQQLIMEISRPITRGDKRLQLGASIGIALYPDHGSDHDSLRREADQAMYAVKQHGKNAFAFVNERPR